MKTLGGIGNVSILRPEIISVHVPIGSIKNLNGGNHVGSKFQKQNRKQS